MSVEEITPIFERARDRNLVFPQVLQGIAIGMIEDLLNTQNPAEAITRFMQTPLPENLVGDYGEDATTAHAARGINREIDTSGAAWIWEREKCTALAILIRVFFTVEDRKELEMNSDRIIVIMKLLERHIYLGGARDLPQPVIHNELVAAICRTLAKRMQKDTQGVEALRYYGPLFTQALKELPQELAEFRKAFEPIVAEYRNSGDQSRYFTKIGNITSIMLKEALTTASTLLEQKELPSALRGRIKLLISILGSQYYAR